MRNLRNRLEKLEQETKVPDIANMGIPLMFSYDKEARELFTSDDEQRSYMDWRLKQVIDERISAGNYLPIPIMALVNDEQMKDRIDEFRTYQKRVKEIGQEFEKKLRIVLLGDGDTKQSAQEVVEEAERMLVLAGRCTTVAGHPAP